MHNPNDLERALELSLHYHKGQEDKILFPYVFHPIRVMNHIWEEDPEDFTSMIVALLHDLIEDTPCQLKEIEDKFDKEIATAVELLSKRENPDGTSETYNDYINRIKQSKNGTAIKVKLADLKDNLNPLRKKIKESGAATKYITAREELVKVKKELYKE